jgi:hypothetical protein
MPRHREAGGILARLGAEGVTSLYHFSSVDNLSSIEAAGGLCSKEELERLGRWPPPCPGGNALSHSLDHALGRWGQIALSMTPRTPMAYHRKKEEHLCFLRISPSVAGETGVVFTDTNAAAYAARAGEGLLGLDLVDFVAIRSSPRPWDRDGWVKPVQAEVLVPTFIPLAEVESVAFVTEVSRTEGERIWGPAPHPPFSVEPKLFRDGPSAAVTYPHLRRVIVTNEAVTDGTNFNHLIHQSRVAATMPVTVAVELVAGPGVRLTIAIQPDGGSEEHDFSDGRSYWYWTQPVLLRRGTHDVEVSLRSKRWATITFETISGVP